MGSEMQGTIEQILTAAAGARQRGDLDGSDRLLAQAIEAEPGEPRALNMLGMNALDRRAFEQAGAHFRAAAKADPKEPALWMNVAAAERGLSRDEAERAALQQAIDIDQRNLMAQIRMAQLQQRLDERPAAADSWGKVVALTTGTSDMPPGLIEIVEQARAYVRDYKADLAATVEQGIAPLLESADPLSIRRFQACIDAEFGRRSIYRNECSGLHYPFLPADEFFDRTHFPWMETLEAKTDVIRAEFLALIADQGAQVRPYVRQEAGTPQNKWTPLDGSLDWGAAFLWEYGVRNDALCAACPETVAALEALPRADIPGRAPSAFFSLLKPGSRIPPHSGVTNSRAIVHLPLIVPPECYFRVGGETRRWEEGKAFAFDDTIEHEAWNGSEELRVVLIFDVWNPHLSLAEQQLLKQFYAIADASKSAQK